MIILLTLNNSRLIANDHFDDFEQLKIYDYFDDSKQPKIDGCVASFKQAKIDSYFINFFLNLIFLFYFQYKHTISIKH